MFDYPPRIYEDFLGYNYERINFVMAVCGLPVTMISSGFFIVFCFGGPFVLLGFLSDKYLPTGNRNLKFKDYFGKKRSKDNETNANDEEDFLKQHNPKINFVHFDMDTYSPTKFTLKRIKPYLAKDAIIIFDEFYNFFGWEHGEYKAFNEVFKKEEFEYKAFRINGTICVIQIK